jgi:acyl-CoA oxidase
LTYSGKFSELATEMLLGRYSVPAPKNPKGLLALHEAGLYEESHAILSSVSNHRSDDVNRLILPQCQTLIEAMGHRMAYEAAVLAQVPQDLIDLYLASVVKLDLAWYCENTGLRRKAFAEMETKALDAILPQTASYIGKMRMEPWITCKIVSDERWNAFVDSCPVFEGSGNVQLAEVPGEKKRRHEAVAVRSHL